MDRLAAPIVLVTIFPTGPRNAGMERFEPYLAQKGNDIWNFLFLKMIK